MFTTIFIKRPGLATMAVRVFRARPWQMKAARAMRRAGFSDREICSRLQIRPERFIGALGPHSLFKI